MTFEFEEEAQRKRDDRACKVFWITYLIGFGGLVGSLIWRAL